MKYAFFDMDETIIQCKSMFSFYQFFLMQTDNKNHGQRFRQLMSDIGEKVDHGASREEINKFYYEHFIGVDKVALKKIATQWCNESEDIIFIDKVVSEIENLKNDGYFIVIVSGAMRDIIEPIGDMIGVDFYLCSEPSVVDGKYTGKLAQQSIGDGKRNLIVNFCQEHLVALDECVAYGDHTSDIPMLTAVGKAYVVNPNHEMRKVLNELKLNEI
jgi:HAD superfamily hydrolase (TIGR01490 family)